VGASAVSVTVISRDPILTMSIHTVRAVLGFTLPSPPPDTSLGTWESGSLYTSRHLHPLSCAPGSRSTGARVSPSQTVTEPVSFNKVDCM
jgi:hypothetical protein